MKFFQPRHRQLLGKRGEDLAVSYLQKHGFRIIERNFKVRYGEIDIVSVVGDILVFVEVKTRIGEKFGKPEEAVTPRKLREVIQTAEYYKMCHDGLPDAMRIDVIGIELTPEGDIVSFNHIQSIT
jgi:uncharacterized protein (TIGR00252 family)